MLQQFTDQIAAALGSGGAAELAPQPRLVLQGEGALRSCLAVSDLAVAAFGAAAQELGALCGAEQVTLDRRLALRWFGSTLRPLGWQVPSLWDPVAGDYRGTDGWIRLHTNAPHHRAAALEVLGVPAARDRVARAVSGWATGALEAAVLAQGGAAAAMHGLQDWARGPVGQAVAAEPLIDWRQIGSGPRRTAQAGGWRVLDLTRVLAGPVATRFLAGFGAQVLRIDPPGWNEPGVEPEVTLGKRRAGLDLRRAADRELFEALLARADVLVHGYRPGALEGLGYGAAQRQRLAPGLIDVSLNAYGWHSPWSGRRGFDSLVQMSCGIAAAGMARAGAAHPVPLPVQALDHATGYLMAAAVLRALRQRQASGALFAARLSLARTAALLVSGGEGPFQGAGVEETETDLAPELEQTRWGPARRLRFPVTLDGRGPCWRFPAGGLREDAPRW